MGLRKSHTIQLTLASLLFVATMLFVPPSVRAPGPTYVDEIGFGNWTQEGSPYVIVGDVTVPFGHELNITEGVEIRFSENTGLLVLGRLKVHGKDGARVVFTSNSSLRSPGDWRGIVVGEASRGNYLRYARVEYAVYGIGLYGESSITISNSEIINCSAGGVHLARSQAEIHNSSVASSNAGILADNSEIYISYSEIHSNQDLGLLLSYSSVWIESTAIYDNTEGVRLTGSNMNLFNSTIDSLGNATVLRDVSSVVALNSYFDKERVVLEGLPSSMLIEWFLDVHVQDMYLSDVSWATVEVGSPLIEQMVFSTNSEGCIETLVVRELFRTNHGQVNYNPYWVNASKLGTESSMDLYIVKSTTVTLRLQSDFASPRARAGGDLTVNEDEEVFFDAGSSEDNDPNLLASGTFTWTFHDYDGPSKIEGVRVAYIFHTPGSYNVKLRVEDAFGNWDEDYLKVQVEDITNPNAVISIPWKTRVGESIVLDATASNDNDPDFPRSGSYFWRFMDGIETITLEGKVAEYSFRYSGSYPIELQVSDSSGNTDTDVAMIQVLEAPSEFPIIPLLSVAFVGAALACIANTEVGKYWFFKLLILPLYVKLSKKDILDHFIRGQIYGYIKVNPGDNYTTIKRNLNLKNGTLTYHLDVLERGGLIKSHMRGTRKHYYPSEMKVPDDGRGFPAVKSEILGRLAESPGITISDLASLVGISRQLANYHIRGLIKEGYARVERKGMKTRCYLKEEKSDSQSNLHK
ncbi:MAG: PKD domain-containing protein [Thermoplasmata archaeon]